MEKVIVTIVVGAVLLLIIQLIDAHLKKVSDLLQSNLDLLKENSALKEINRTLQVEANQVDIDPLTKLLNRRGAERKCLELGSEDGKGLCAIYIDFNKFKEINDTFGHDVGDSVLVQATSIMAGLIRNDDILCRRGGDEFLLIMKSLTRDSAMSKAEELREAIASATFQHGEQVTASFGVAFAEVADDLPSLFKEADAAMYQAKSSGRNQVVMG